MAFRNDNQSVRPDRDRLDTRMQALDHRPATSTTTVRSHSFVHKSDEEILEELRALRPKLEAGLRYLRNR